MGQIVLNFDKSYLKTLSQIQSLIIPLKIDTKPGVSKAEKSNCALPFRHLTVQSK
jgi:hypothetical protein